MTVMAMIEFDCSSKGDLFSREKRVASGQCRTLNNEKPTSSAHHQKYRTPKLGHVPKVGAAEGTRAATRWIARVPFMRHNALPICPCAKSRSLSCNKADEHDGPKKFALVGTSP